MEDKIVLKVIYEIAWIAFGVFYVILKCKAAEQYGEKNSRIKRFIIFTILWILIASIPWVGYLIRVKNKHEWSRVRLHSS